MDGQINSTLELVNSTSGFDVNSLASTVVKTILYSILLLLSSIGNTLVIIIVYRDETLRSNVDIFIVNMAVSDLLIPVFAIPKRIYELYMDTIWLVGGHFGSFLCKFFPFAENIANMVSVLTLVMIAVERFYSVVLPIYKPPVTKTNRLWFVVASWFLPIGAFSHLFFSWKLKLDTNGRHCQYSWGFQAWKIEFYVFFSFVIALPLFLIAFLYSTVIISLQRRKRKLNLANEQRKRREKRNRKIVFLLLLLVTVFILSWTPYSIFIFLYLFQPALILHSVHYKRMYFAALFSSLAFTAINPCLYYVFSKNYKRGLHKCLTYLIPFHCDCFVGSANEGELVMNRAEIEMARQRASTVRFTDLGV